MNWTRVHAPDVARLFYLQSNNGISYQDALHYKEALEGTAEVAPWGMGGAIVTPPSGNADADPGTAKSMFGVYSAVSPEHFRFFGVGDGGAPFVYGRGFRADEFAADGPRVVVVDYTFWQRRMAADPEILGKFVRINGVPFEVVGVAPRYFENTGLPHQVYIPITRVDDISHRPRLNNPNGPFRPLVRFPANAGVAEAKSIAQARLEVAGRRLDAEAPQDKERRLTLANVQGDVTAPEAAHLLLVGAVGLLLLLTSANVANLLLARAAGRQKEIAVRAALGAGRWRLARRLLIESLTMSLAGGVLGLGVNRLLTAWVEPFYNAMPIGFAGLWEGNDWSRIDERVVLFTLMVSVLTGAFFGLAPIAAALRTDLVSALKGTDAMRTWGRRFNARQLLVVAQVALSTVLVLATALLVRSVDNLQEADLGFETDRHVLLALAATPPPLGEGENREAESREARQRIYEIARERLATVPGVESITIASGTPSGFSGTTKMELPNRPGEAFDVDSLGIGKAFFETYGIGPVRGRLFNEGDRAGSAGAVIVDQAFAERFFPDQEALGQEIRLLGRRPTPEEHRFTVVGVAPTVRVSWRQDDLKPRVYLPMGQYMGQYLFGKQVLAGVRLQGPPATVLPALRRAAVEAHPELALLDDGTFERLHNVDLVMERLWAVILIFFGGVGLVLACLGIFSMMSYAVSRRQREMGIRTAIGATVEDLLRLVLGEASRLVMTGIVVGGLAALAVGQLLRGFLYGVTPYDPWTFGLLPLMLLTVAVAAAWLPAHRAGRVDPVTALRTE